MLAEVGPVKQPLPLDLDVLDALVDPRDLGVQLGQHALELRGSDVEEWGVSLRRSAAQEREQATHLGKTLS